MSIVNFEELQNVTEYKQAGDIKKCLEKQGIVTFYGKGKRLLWTTEALINAAGGLKSTIETEPADKYL